MLVDLIDNGNVRFTAMGRLTVVSATVSVFFVVHTGDSSLDAAVARIATLRPSSPVRLQEEKIALPIGQAVKVTTLLYPDGGSPSQGFEYIIRLPEGATLWLAGSSPKGDDEMGPLMATIARSLSR